MNDPIPTTWPALAAQAEPLTGVTLQRLSLMAKSVAKRKPERPIAGDLVVPSLALCQIAVVSGPLQCANGISLFSDLVRRAIDDLEKGLARRNPAAAMGPLQFENAAHACGHAVAQKLLSPVTDNLHTLVSEREHLNEFKCQTLAFACVAHARSDLVRDLIPHDIFPDQFEPGSKFGFNEQAFIGYLVSALEAGAQRSDVLPAWVDFLAWFPRKLAAETLIWDDVVFAARAIHTHFGGDRDQTVAEWLHMEIEL
jgi:hypothetical protein